MSLVSFKKCFLLAACFFLFSAVSHAGKKVDIYLINHFGQPILFTITANPQVFPELTGPFTLQAGEQLRTTAVETEKQAYIYGVTDKIEDKIYKAFWGLKIVNGIPKFQYYSERDSGISFSWVDNVITFCTYDEYKKKHSC